MAELYTILDTGKYKLFLPPSTYLESDCIIRHKKIDEANNAAIAAHDKWETPEKPITGSFIYAHPPNYHGLPTVEFTRSDWMRELGRLKRCGMDTVIFQASLWSELNECYYPTKIFTGMKNYNVIEPMLDAAKELGFTVFLGGYGSVTCWRARLDAGIVEQEFSLQMQCYRELLQYRDQFDGFYFSPESAFSGSRNPELEKMLGELYGKLFSTVKEVDPSLKILMSPATFYYPEPGKMQEMTEAWCAMFAKAHPDILAPQDSIGCGCITLDHQIEALKAWKNVCDRCGITFWSNVEVFDACPPYVNEHSRCPGKTERVAMQIANASRFCEKLITWEALYYFSDLCPAGKDLAKFLFGDKA